jgi:hypothetical protein
MWSWSSFLKLLRRRSQPAREQRVQVRQAAIAGPAGCYAAWICFYAPRTAGAPEAGLFRFALVPSMLVPPMLESSISSRVYSLPESIEIIQLLAVTLIAGRFPGAPLAEALPRSIKTPLCNFRPFLQVKCCSQVAKSGKESLLRLRRMRLNLKSEEVEYAKKAPCPEIL